MEKPAWVHKLFDSIDAKDTSKFLTFLTDDAQFKFGNAPAAVGKAAIEQAVGGFFQSIKGLRHNILGTWVHPATVISQGEVTYMRHDGSELTIPFVNVFGMNGDHIKNYQIYMDITPLFAPAQ